MRRTTTLVAALLAVMLGSFAVDSSAQGVQTGSIRGTVSDQQNLPVPGVTVTIQSPALQGIRSTTTEGDGSYAFLRLPPGRYALTYEISSFAPVKRTTDVLLGLSVEQNITLTAAGRTEEVQVVAAAPAPIVNPTVGANLQARGDPVACHAAQPAGHRAARTRHHREHAERRPARHQRRVRVRQRVHAERRGRQRQPVRLAAEPLHRGRDRGDADSHLRHHRRVRPLHRRRRQRHDQVRRQQLQRQLADRTSRTRRGPRRRRSSAARSRASRPRPAGRRRPGSTICSSRMKPPSADRSCATNCGSSARCGRRETVDVDAAAADQPRQHTDRHQQAR